MKYILAIVWTVGIIVASGLSKGMVQELSLSDLFSIDKIAHAFVYMIYVILWARAMIKDRGFKRGVLLAFYSSVFLGIVMEILQLTIFSGRSFEYLDIIANISGSLLGWMILLKFFKN